MAFVNEYISEEDIKKYNLEEDWIRRNPQYRPEGRPTSCPLKWTIDRERNVHLMDISYGGRADDGLPGRRFRLDWDGKSFLCWLEYGAGRSRKYNEVPYIIVWNLVSITPHDLHKVSREQVIQWLKEALIVFGDDGANSYVQNAIVKFNF